MLRNWPRKIRGCYDGCFVVDATFEFRAWNSSYLPLTKEESSVVEIGLKFVAREGDGEGIVCFFFFNFNQAHRIARFSSSFHFLRNFDRSQSGKEWCAALRVANTLDSRLSPGLRFSRNACWNGNDHDFHVKKILVDYSSSDLEKIRVLRFEISIDFSRRESII